MQVMDGKVKSLQFENASLGTCTVMVRDVLTIEILSCSMFHDCDPFLQQELCCKCFCINVDGDMIRDDANTIIDLSGDEVVHATKWSSIEADHQKKWTKAMNKVKEGEGGKKMHP